MIKIMFKMSFLKLVVYETPNEFLKNDH